MNINIITGDRNLHSPRAAQLKRSYGRVNNITEIRDLQHHSFRGRANDDYKLAINNN